MNSKEYTKELGKLVKLYKKEALKRRVRIPIEYMSWDDFVGIGSNCIAYLKLHGGNDCNDVEIVSSGLMSNIAIIPGKAGKFRCYCVDTEFVKKYEGRANLSYQPNDPSIIFFPRCEADGMSVENAVVVYWESETKTICFLLFSSFCNDEIRVATRRLDLCKLNDNVYKFEDESAESMCIMTLDALATLDHQPEYQDINTEPRQMGFGKGGQIKTETYEYPTILKPRILPINPIRIDHGGTHASPRPHDRRGHWRRKPKGDTNDLIWVKSSKVGAQV